MVEKHNLNHWQISFSDFLIILILKSVFLGITGSGSSAYLLMYKVEPWLPVFFSSNL